MTTSADPVAAYLADVRAGLRGPRRTRADMLAEVHTGLLDAVEHHVGNGMPAPLARSTAVAGFGRAADLSAGLQAELAVSQTRRTATAVVVVFPLLAIGWSLVWTLGPGWEAPAPPLVAALSRLLDGSSVVLTVSGATLLIATRTTRPVGTLARAYGAIAAIGALCCVGLTVAMNVANSAATTHLLTHNVAAVPAFVATAVALSVVGTSAVRSWTWARQHV